MSTVRQMEESYQLCVAEEDMEKCLNYCRYCWSGLGLLLVLLQGVH